MLRFCVVPCKLLLFRFFLQFLLVLTFFLKENWRFFGKFPHTSSIFLMGIIKVISKSWKSYGRPWKGVKGLAKVRWSSIFIFIMCFAITSTFFYHPRRCAVPTKSAHSNFLNFNKKDACDILSLQKIKMNKKNHLNTFS